MHLQVLNQLIDMMKEVNKKPVTEYPAFMVFVYLRNKLIELGLDAEIANRVMAAMDVMVPMEFAHDADLMQGVFNLADEMAILIINTHKAMMTEFDSVEVFLKLIEGAHIKIE